MKQKYSEPIIVSLRKADIYERRNPEVSSLEKSHAILTEVDPDSYLTLEQKRKDLGKVISSYHQSNLLEH